MLLEDIQLIPQMIGNAVQPFCVLGKRSRQFAQPRPLKGCVVDDDAAALAGSDSAHKCFLRSSQLTFQSKFEGASTVFC